MEYFKIILFVSLTCCKGPGEKAFRERHDITRTYKA